MAQLGSLDFRGFVDGRRHQRAGGAEGSGHAYAYVSDRTTRLAFDRIKPVELAVTAAVRMFKAVSKNELLGHAVKVGPKQFPRVHNLVVRCAETLGIALQLINIMRDVPEDWQLGRVYLPQDELAAFDVTEADLAAGVATPAFRRLMAFQGERARAYLARGA